MTERAVVGEIKLPSRTAGSAWLAISMSSIGWGRPHAVRAAGHRRPAGGHAR
jgi:hypothetical protein